MDVGTNTNIIVGFGILGLNAETSKYVHFYYPPPPPKKRGGGKCNIGKQIRRIKRCINAEEDTLKHLW